MCGSFGSERSGGSMNRGKGRQSDSMHAMIRRKAATCPGSTVVRWVHVKTEQVGVVTKVMLRRPNRR